MGTQIDNSLHPEGARILDKIRASESKKIDYPIGGVNKFSDEAESLFSKAILDQYGIFTAKRFEQQKMGTALLVQMQADKDSWDDLMDEYDDVRRMTFNPSTLHVAYYEDDGDLIADFNLEPVLKPFLETIVEEKIYYNRKITKYGLADLSPEAGSLSRPLHIKAGSNQPDNGTAAEKDADKDSEKPVEKTSGGGSSDSKKADGSNVPTTQAGEKKPEVARYERPTSEEFKEFYEIVKTKRENVLSSTLQESPDDILRMRAELDPALVRNAVDGTDTFDREWRNFDNFSEIENLFTVDNHIDTGYKVNPFKVAGFNLDSLQDLIKDKSDKNNTLTFEAISERVFTDRYDQFTGELKKAGVTKTCLDLIEEDVGKDVEEIDDPLDDDNLVKSFQKITQISNKLSNVGTSGEIKDEGLRKLWPHKDEIKLVAQYLGDYVAPISTLINYLQNAKVNSGEELDGEKTMDKDHSPIAIALKELFLNNNDKHDLKRYDDELHEVLGVGKNPPKAKFRDLDGNVSFVDGNWFNERQSAETAYKLAYEAAEPPLGKNGEIPEGLDEESARIYVNRLLNLGTATLPVIKANESIGKVINKLRDAGVTIPPDNEVIKFKNDVAMDQRNLYAALEVHNISELTENRIEKGAIAKFNARHLLMRIGSVVNQKEQEKANRERIAKDMVLNLKLKPEEIKGLMENLKATGKFSEAELKNVENRMIVGIALVGNVDAEHWYNAINGVGLSGGFPIPLGHNITMNIGGAVMAGHGYALNAGVGKKYVIDEKSYVTLTSSVGVNFGAGKTTVGPSEQVVFTRELDSCDVYAEAGASAGFDVDNGKLFPGFNAAVGFDRTRQAIDENYNANIEKAYSDSGIIKLDKLLPEDRYAEVSNNPNKYPGLGDMALRLKNSTPSIAHDVQVRVFNDTYTGFKETKTKNSLKDAVDDVHFAGLKAGVSTTVLPSPFPPFFVEIPTPNIGVEFVLWHRKLTYISSTPMKEVKGMSADDLQMKLVQHLKEQGQDIVQIDGPVINIKSSGTLVYLPGSTEHEGRYVLANVQAIDFSQFTTNNPDNIGKIKEELAKNAGMSVKEVKPGQLTLTPYKAHGEIEIFGDPRLSKDVYLTSNKGDFILSAPNDANLKITRFDVTLPLQDNGVVEKTVIVVSDRSDFDFQAVQQLAINKLTKFPGRAFTINKVNDALGNNTANRNAIVDYTTFTQNIEPNLKNRLKSGPVNDSEYQNRRTEAGKGLLKEVTSGQSETVNFTINEKVTRFTDILKEKYSKMPSKGYKPGDPALNDPDIAALISIKSNITNKFDLGKWFTPIESRVDMDAVEKAINIGLQRFGYSGGVPSPQEFAFIIREITDATFLQFEQTVKKNDRNEFYKKKFLNYDMPMFIMALEGEKGNPELEFSAEEIDGVKSLLMENMSSVDFDPSKADIIKNGTFLMQDVGNIKLKVKGEVIYLFQNATGARTEGVLNRLNLSPSDSNPIKHKLAQYLILKNSPYKTRTAEGLAVDEKTDIPKDRKLQMEHELRSIVSQRILTVLPVMLTDVEMNQVTKFLHDPENFELNAKDHDMQHDTDVTRFDTIKKVIGYIDRIREAEVSGAKNVALDTEGKWVMETIPVAYVGIYTVCTNYVKALEDEVFALHGKDSRQVHVSQWTGAMSEASILTYTEEQWRGFSVTVGLAIPIPKGTTHSAPKKGGEESCVGDDCDNNGGGGKGGQVGGGGEKVPNLPKVKITLPKFDFKTPENGKPAPNAGVNVTGADAAPQGAAANDSTTTAGAGAGYHEDTNTNGAQAINLGLHPTNGQIKFDLK